MTELPDTEKAYCKVCRKTTESHVRDQYPTAPGEEGNLIIRYECSKCKTIVGTAHVSFEVPRGNVTRQENY